MYHLKITDIEHPYKCYAVPKVYLTVRPHVLVAKCSLIISICKNNLIKLIKVIVYDKSLAHVISIIWEFGLISKVFACSMFRVQDVCELNLCLIYFKHKFSELWLFIQQTLKTSFKRLFFCEQSWSKGHLWIMIWTEWLSRHRSRHGLRFHEKIKHFHSFQYKNEMWFIVPFYLRWKNMTWISICSPCAFVHSCHEVLKMLGIHFKYAWVSKFKVAKDEPEKAGPTKKLIVTFVFIQMKCNLMITIHAVLDSTNYPVRDSHLSKVHFIYALKDF